MSDYDETQSTDAPEVQETDEALKDAQAATEADDSPPEVAEDGQLNILTTRRGGVLETRPT